MSELDPDQITIRTATPEDRDQILSIYKPIVKNTAISFSAQPPTPDELSAKIKNVLKNYPWIVLEYREEIAGYTYASSFRGREAYQWCVEPSIYVKSDYHGQGIATVLYTTLFKILSLQGFHKAIAIIALPNEPSIKLHQRLGFQHIGVIQKAGYKLGNWHDISWWNRDLLLGEKKVVMPPEPFMKFKMKEAHKNIFQQAKSLLVKG
ncbi:MAG: GNAT family N-acetyltransferase [Balneolaceae bacterium]|jgi:phosphinothricin acetyltransferase